MALRNVYCSAAASCVDFRSFTGFCVALCGRIPVAHIATVLDVGSVSMAIKVRNDIR